MKKTGVSISDRIAEVGLRPSDIVKLQVLSGGKPIGLSQATGWIKNPTSTKAIEQLLWRMCDEKVESGITLSRPGRKKSALVAENFSKPDVKNYKPLPESFDDSVVQPAHPFINEEHENKATIVQAISDKKVKLPKFSANTLDQPMTRKLKVDKSGQHWVIYCTKNKYRLPLNQEDFIIVLEEGEFTINDFKIS